MSTGAGYVLATSDAATGGLRFYLRQDDNHRINCDGPAGVDVRDGAAHEVGVSGRWHGTLALTIDGVEQPCDTSEIDDLTNDAVFTIGGSTNSAMSLPAVIDDVRFTTASSVP